LASDTNLHTVWVRHRFRQGRQLNQ
jgi:hypothetical protein